MTNDRMFPTEVTAEERELGFQLEVIPTQNRFPQSSQGTMPAVIHPLGVSDRIIKLRRPDGVFTYKHQRYGQLEGETGCRLEWHPFGDSDSLTPEEALSKARHGIEDDSTCRVIPRVPPSQQEDNRE